MTTNGAWIKQEDGNRKPGLVRQNEADKPPKKKAPKRKREE